MNPSSEFSAQLNIFNAGRPRRTCSIDFRIEVAIRRFPPVNETTIEEKHAHVSLELKRHHIKAVRVSLSNRLHMLERFLELGRIDIRQFVANFAKARNMVQCAKLLGIDDNPELQAASCNTSSTNRNQFRKALQKRCVSM